MTVSNLVVFLAKNFGRFFTFTINKSQSKFLKMMLWYLLITLLTWKAFATTNNQHLICKSVLNIFQNGLMIGTNHTPGGNTGPGESKGNMVQKVFV